MARSQATRSTGQTGLTRVVRKVDGVEIGMLGVSSAMSPIWDIGFSFFPEYWSQGYALESARAVMRHAREALRLGRILAITTVDNEPSMRLLGKLGFRPEGIVNLGGEDLRLFVSEP